MQAPSGSGEIARLLITKETYWSAQLFSLAPYGLNKRKEFLRKTEFAITNFPSHIIRFRNLVILDQDNNFEYSHYLCNG